MTDAKDYVGMSVEDAKALAEERGVPFRLGSMNGEVFVLTMDYLVGRVTASVNDGVVTSYSVEGM